MHMCVVHCMKYSLDTTTPAARRNDARWDCARAYCGIHLFAAHTRALKRTFPPRVWTMNFISSWRGFTFSLRVARCAGSITPCAASVTHRIDTNQMYTTQHKYTTHSIKHTRFICALRIEERVCFFIGVCVYCAHSFSCAPITFSLSRLSISHSNRITFCVRPG